MNQKLKISILGGGWLGFPLALYLKKRNHEVIVSSTSIEKIKIFEQNQLNGQLLQINGNDDPIDSKVFESKILIIAIPPKSKHAEAELFLKKIKQIVDSIKLKNVVEKVILISSTSVYPDTPGLKSEDDADTLHPLFKAEEYLKLLLPNHQVIIIRSGGLMGYDRNPCKYFGIREFNADSRVNYVHRDDAVKVVSWIAENINKNLTVNLCAPLHPTRGEIATQVCLFNIDSESSLKEGLEGKVIDTTFLHSFYPNEFIYPDPLKFRYL